MKTCRVWCAVAAFGVAVVVASAGASADLIVDQQNTASNSFIGPGDGQGQSFTPTLSGIDFVTFSLGVGGPDSEQVFATIFRGDGVTGPIIGISNVDLVSAATFNSYEFDFSPTISLVPGDVYTLGLNNGFGDLYATESSGDAYAGGTEYNSAGVAQNGYDLTFSEGVQATSLPEPSAALVLPAVGLIATGSRTLRRRFGAAR